MGKTKQTEQMTLNFLPIDLREVRKALKRAVDDWEQNVRDAMKDSRFDGYEKLAEEMHLHPMTIRKYMIIVGNPAPIPLENFFFICNRIKDRRPIDVFYQVACEAMI